MGRPRKVPSPPTEGEASTDTQQTGMASLPVHPQPAKERPLPTVDPDAPSRLDGPAFVSLAQMLEAAMRLRGVDPEKTPRKEFFELLMWEWTLDPDPQHIKTMELGARILGRGYIGEKSGDDKTTEP